MKTHTNTTTTATLRKLLNATSEEEIIQLYKDGHDIDATEFGGFTSMHLCDFSGASEMLANLSSSRARTAALPEEHASISRLTPLHVQALRGNEKMVKLLLEKGANPFAMTDSGDRPIDMTSYPEVIRLLQEKMDKSYDESECKDDDVNWEKWWSPLHEVETADMVAKLVQEGYDVNERDHKGLTPLHLARNGKVACALLAEGADLNLRNKNGLTPLLYNDNEEVNRVLLEAGARVDGCTRAGTPDVFLAAKHGKLRLFYENGADLTITTPRGESCLNYIRRAEELKLLLQAGLDMNTCNFQGMHPWYLCANAEVQHAMLDAGFSQGPNTWHGFSLLMAAADASVVKRLLGMGYDVNHAGALGRTPLFLYISGSSYKALLDGGADVNHRDERGLTPLHTVASHADAVEMLLEAGANPHARTHTGRTPLHAADAPASVRLLLEAGADVNAADSDGMTPLHRCTSHECMEVLLEAGANPNARNNLGMTPLHLARRWSDIELLVKHGADVNAVANNGRTPLHYAVSFAIADRLLMHGASPAIRDKDGKLPFERMTDSYLRRQLLHAYMQEMEHTKPEFTPQVNRLWEILQTDSLEQMKTELQKLVLPASTPDQPAADSPAPHTGKQEIFELRSAIRKRLIKKYGLEAYVDHRRHTPGEKLSTSDWCDIMHTATRELTERELDVMVDLADEFAGNAYWATHGSKLCEHVYKVHSQDMTIKVAKLSHSRFPLDDAEESCNVPFKAASRGDLPFIRRMVEEVGISVDACHTDIRPQDSGTLLTFAIGSINYDMVTYLLEQGADPNVKAAKQYPPLAYSLVNLEMYNMLDVVRLLLEHGAEQHDFIYEGELYSPISFAMANGYDDMVELLEKHLG